MPAKALEERIRQVPKVRKYFDMPFFVVFIRIIVFINSHFTLL